MKLITLGSSSDGNGYILQATTGEALIIEAGIPLAEVKRAIGFNLANIAGVVVSHSHQDHSKRLPEYQKAGITCIMNEATQHVYFPDIRATNIITLPPKVKTSVGQFTILGFELKHDVPNFGYLIHHPESGLVCFITDTHYCPFVFPGLNNILIEANYSLDIMDRAVAAGRIPATVRNRILGSHMEIETTKEFLKANDLTGVNNIVLLHLSDGNSNARDFKNQVQELTGKPTEIADQGLTIDFNKTAF